MEWMRIENTVEPRSGSLASEIGLLGYWEQLPLEL